MNFLIYFFLLLIVFCAFLVILSKNLVESVLFLILVYLFTASFFMLLGTEFLAILIFIIYIGAISILFLFVIMLLNLRSIELYNTFFNYFPIGSFIGFLFFLEIFYLFSFDFSLTMKVFFFDSDIFNF
jgi:NADH-quinone oxidoreductase subunit J